MKRKICVVTGSRSEYGILFPLLKELKNTSGVEKQLIVTGSHLSADFGYTYKEISDDGFKIDRKVSILTGKDDTVAMSAIMASAIKGMADAYVQLKPDIIVLLGDRYEIFCAAVAALVNKIPVAHIHGGELTEGVIDDAFRHSITKMSHIHFTSTNIYKRRVIQLGENPQSVFTVGALGLDNIKRMDFLTRRELEMKLGLRLKQKNLLVAFHPLTLAGKNNSESEFRELLKGLNGLKDTLKIFTYANADMGGISINKMIRKYVLADKCNSVVYPSLGRIKFLSLMKHVDCIIGNSSSGIIEAPSLHIATVNIGDRQKGRVRAKSIIDCQSQEDLIKKAINKSFTPDFKAVLRSVENPYGNGNAALHICNVLRKYQLKDILKKHFYDL